MCHALERILVTAWADARGSIRTSPSDGNLSESYGAIEVDHRSALSRCQIAQEFVDCHDRFKCRRLAPDQNRWRNPALPAGIQP
jgi:hypothetical protein